MFPYNPFSVSLEVTFAFIPSFSYLSLLFFFSLEKGFSVLIFSRNQLSVLFFYCLFLLEHLLFLLICLLWGWFSLSFLFLKVEIWLTELRSSFSFKCRCSELWRTPLLCLPCCGCCSWLQSSPGAGEGDGSRVSDSATKLATPAKIQFFFFFSLNRSLLDCCNLLINLQSS